MSVFLKDFSFQYLLLYVMVFHITSFSQTDESWKLYDDSSVGRIDISVNPDALVWLYQNVYSDSEFVASFHFQNSLINESVDSVGFRLRGNTSRNAQKKSFKISFNTFVSGREFYGVDKLNLNGEHNDPSIIRSKLCFDHYQTIGMAASRANHVKVYINGNYYGLYISVEHIDDEFLNKNFADDSGNLWKCLYPADLKYLGGDPNLYKELNQDGRPAYELSTNESINDFSKLVRLISILNNTSSASLADSLESVIEIHEVLKYFAMNILVGGWDSYWSLMNNYYLYHEPAKDIFHIVPYDYDNTYGISWSDINWTTANPYSFPKLNSDSRPLAEKLMQNPQYRNLYTHFLEFFRQNVYQLNIWQNKLDALRIMITQPAIDDNFRTLDYGFNTGDFFNSYSETEYNNKHVKFGLKQFVNLRNASLPAQLSYQAAKPIAYKIDFEPINPQAEDSIKVYVSAFDNNGLSEVSIHFQKDGLSIIDIFPMQFSPIVNTKKVDEADRWVGFIPPLGANSAGKFFVYVKDNQNQSQFYPRKKAIEIKTPQIVSAGIVINEFMADNSSFIADQDGDFDDWIEIFNPTNSPVLLTGKYLTDKKNNLVKYQFIQPNLILNPNEFLLIWCDEEQTQQGIHTNFKLSAGGEFIALTETDGISVIDSITFGTQTTNLSFGRKPDASTIWMKLNPTPGYSNTTTSVEEEMIISEFNLSAYPNPFNPSTIIRYNIPANFNNKTDKVILKIFDILGREVTTLVNEDKSAGNYEVKWNAKNNSGSAVSTGIYFAKFFSGSKTKYLKLMLLK